MTDAFAPPPTEDIPVISTTTNSGSYATTIPSAVAARPQRTDGSSSGAGSNLAVDMENDPKFRYFGAPALVALAADNRFVQTGTKPGGIAQAARWIVGIEFNTNSDVIEILHRAGAANAGLGMLFVNGRWVQETQLAVTVAAGNWVYTKLTFPSAGPRRVVLYMNPEASLNGVYVGAGHSVVRPTNAVKRRIAFITDSIGNASIDYKETEAFSLRVGYLMGADQVILAGIGGTKWVAATSGSADQLAAHFGGRLPAVLAMNPHAIVFVGSRNDDAGAAAIQSAVEATLDLAAAVPEVYVAGPITTGFATNNGAVKAGAISKGRPFADIAGVISGTGRVGATTGIGNADYFISTDGIHPTKAGQKHIARRLFEAITRAFGMS